MACQCWSVRRMGWWERRRDRGSGWKVNMVRG
jgi:hypothetical protein